MAQSILSNTVIATLGRVGNVAFGLLATALITRYLGPAQFGSYALLFSYGAIILLIADFGLYLTLSREIAEGSPQHGAEIFCHVLSLRLILLAVSFVVGLGIVLFLPSFKGLVLAYIVVSIGLSFQSLSQLCMSVFQNHGEVWRATVGDVAGRLVQVAGILAIGAIAASTKNMAIIFTASTGVAFVVYWLLLPRSSGARVMRVKGFARQWKRLLRDSWPLGLMLLLNAVYFRIDTVLLSLFRSSAEVGWYGVSYRIIESALFFPAMFGGLLLPRLSEAVGRQKTTDVKKYLDESLKFLVVMAAGAVFVLSFGSRQIISLIAGEKFLHSAPLLSLLSWSLAIMFVGNLFGFALIALHQQKSLLKLYLFLVIFNVAANLIFIPRWGAAAACWTTIATEALSSGVAGWLVFKAVGWRVDPAFVTRMVATVAVTWSITRLFLIDLPGLIQIVSTGALYVAVATFTGALHLGSLKLLRSAPGILPNEIA